MKAERLFNLANREDVAVQSPFPTRIRVHNPVPPIDKVEVLFNGKMRVHGTGEALLAVPDVTVEPDMFYAIVVNGIPGE